MLPDSITPANPFPFDFMHEGELLTSLGKPARVIATGEPCEMYENAHGDRFALTASGRVLAD